MKITEYFQDTQQTIEREATAEEKAALELAAVQEKARIENEEMQKTQLQAEKNAILEKLGLTEYEMKLISS